MADAPVSWSRNSTVFSVDPNEKLFVFGYSCKIFRDDDKAKYIDQGKHLIPWMGDKTLMIDRYDVRGYLHDLKQYEPKAESCEDPLADEELQCDEERYRSLRSDMSEEQLYHEEELKRLRAAIAGDGAYHEIAFTYGSAENQNYEEQEASKVEEPEDELFEIPQGLNVPKDMELPYTMKIHAIIEKTANFVSQQGGQMEIIIKMKQHANPQFAFMHLDNPLHPYYKHLVKEIKSGAYKPVEVKKVSQSEDEDDDGNYLHPSLMAGKAESVPKFTVPAINFRRSHDDSYSVLVRNLKQHIEEPPPESTTPPNAIAEPESNVMNNVAKDSPSSSMSNSPNSIVCPPPEFRPVVDKMAEYVAKNGDDFEIIVKSRKDKRFDFLHSWHEFYNYYVQKRDLAKATIASIASSVAQESNTIYGPSLENVVVQGCQPPPILQQNISTNSKKEDITNEDFDALYEDTKDSEDSLDFLNSPKDDDDSKSKVKKTTKALKGPISFSLKHRDSDTPPDKPTATALLLNDSDEESGGENNTDPNKRKKALEMLQRTSMLESELKVPRNNELLEAKHAEERMRDKLLATARERMAQQRKEKQMEIDRIKREEQQKKDRILQLDAQRKEKQLQAERKRKAELFLKMLKKKTPDSTAIVSHILGSEKAGPVLQSKKRRRLSSTSQPIPGIKTDWSSDSESEYSGKEEPISVIGEQLSSDNESTEKNKEPASSNLPIFESEESRKHSKRNKKHKKKKHRSSSRSMSRSHSRSKSKTPPSRYREEKKVKKLPAAYALDRRSRSRSRSPPPRYKPFYNNYNHNPWYRRR
ncbi:hypothetical protein JTE90_002060 [Oedothorax gibbosus]|uniref:SURP motif domain-containing protein n=1 Tax=Oedothorax gibbosus TaxID=931172 RepID=A0AAV6UE67_9ARAC|nr:hypothetical protein JTE90_002060 [Oedothorax gibbosus]